MTTTSSPVVLTTELRRVLEGPPATGNVVVATRVADTHCLLGECVIYDDLSNKILWTDILGKAFYRLDLQGDFVLERKPLPRILNSFAMRKNGGGYLCAWEDGFQLYDVDTNTAVSDMSKGEPVNPIGLPTRLNDGRCDRGGKFYVCGGFYGNLNDAKMKVFKCESRSVGGEAQQQLYHQAIVPEIQTTNSICFSPRGDTMYLADSPTETISKYEYNQETGQPVLDSKQDVWKWSNQHQQNKDDGIGHPDGSCVDSKGYIWNALWREGTGTGRVHCIDPNSGKVLQTVMLADSTTSQCTCCCLGGPYMNVLFITTASVGRDAQLEPHAGALYAVKVDAVGLKENRFDG